MDALNYLGHTVKDQVSDLVGICTSVTYFDTGTIQIGVQPKGDGKTFPDSISIDVETIVLLPEVDRLDVVEVTEPVNFLGKMIKDKLTGLKGLATRRHVYQNGCVYYSVKHEKLNDKGSVVITAFASDHIELVNPPKKDVIEKASEARPRTGGPSSKTLRIS